MPAHMTPKARPLRAMNHSSRKMIVGVYSMEPPIAYKTPWVRIRCETRVAKEEATRPIIMVNRPTTAQWRRRSGNR